MRWNVAVKTVLPLLHTQCVSIQISANERGVGVACTNYWGPTVRKGPRARLCCLRFFLSL